MPAVNDHNSLWNRDLAPTTAMQRNWAWFHFAALWIGMIVAVPTWMVASGLIEQGMSAGQAVATVLIGNIIIMIPLSLIGHAGARYGVPFAVLARASFGTTGAKIPAIARALVACGWYGIQTWIGGEALLTLLGVLTGRDLRGPVVPLLDARVGELLAFLLFWAFQLQFVTKGLTTIRRLETWTAPIKVAVCVALVWWMVGRAGGPGPIFASPSAFETGGTRAGHFWAVFWPSLTAMAGLWGTLALNIPDFTRFARSQRDQLIGQSIALPPTMGLIALAGVMTTSATVVVYGHAIWDPVAIAGTLAGPLVLIGLIVISVDTISCNIAANLVCSAYDFSSLSPARISYRLGAVITSAVSILIMPWKLIATSEGYIFTWLTGYGALLGPIAGILIADYWLVRRTLIDVEALYDVNGPYRYRDGVNRRAIIALAIGVLLDLPGFLHVAIPGRFGDIGRLWTTLYDYAYFVGLISALLAYWLMATLSRRRGGFESGSPQSN